MALQFILGPSGSGKTRYLYEEIIRESMAHEERQYLLLVPEQYTMQTQKELIRLHPRHGLTNVDVLSFNRLAYRVFEDLAVETLTVLDDMGKAMILRKAASRRQKELRYYQRHLNQMGFVNQLKSLLSEMYQYGVSPDCLDELRKQAAQPVLREKLGDVSLIFREFQEYIAHKFTTAEEVLDLCCKELPRWETLCRSEIYLDGYTGFTPVQYRILEICMGICSRVRAAVTVDPGEPVYQETEKAELFYMSRHMICQMIDRAVRAGVIHERDVILGGSPPIRFQNRPRLAWVERHVNRYFGESREGGFPDPELGKEEVLVYPGKNPAKEIRFVCRQMKQWLKQGLRYRDMAVITGDLPSYGREIRRQFEEMGIPFFLDDKRSILANPLVELIRSALEVIRMDFPYESVFRCLKTGLLLEGDGLSEEAPGREGSGEAVPEPEPGWEGLDEEALGREGSGEAVPEPEPGREGLDEEALGWDSLDEGASECKDLRVREDQSREAMREELDRMENYVRALGIRGYKRWSQTWERPFRGGESLNLEELNGLRGQVVAAFAALREELREKGSTGASMTEALRRFLEDRRLEEKLEREADRLMAEGFSELSKEYSQVYELIIQLLDRLVGLLGDEPMGLKEFEQILDAGFGEIQVGTIPATVDRVVVGDITRTRLDSIQVLYFVGVNEGVIPQRKENKGLLTDEEREFFSSHQVELAPSARESGLMQRFYLYLMMTKPSRQLVLTYGRYTGSGKELRPSSLIGEVLSMFPDSLQEDSLKEKRLPVPCSYQEAVKLLAEGLKDLDGEGREQTLELFSYLAHHPDYREQARRLAEAFSYTYQERGIGRAAARALYGNILQGSVTRLELYAACAYSHFLRYGLELLERQEYELGAVDMGNLFHQSLDICFQTLGERGLDLASLSAGERDGLVEECVARTVEDYGNTILKSSFRNAYLIRRITRITQRTLWALGEQLKKGDFKPAGFEVSFSAADNLNAMKIALSEEEALHLKGRIDRLDLCEDETHVYVKIIDYKSGTASFDLAALYYGLQLQLVIYMDAALEMEERRHPEKEVVPAGFFYYHIQDPMVEKKEPMTPEEIEEQIKRQLKMDGLVNSDLEVIRRLDREIEGESDVIPVALKAGLLQEGRSSVASGKRFQYLREYVRSRCKKAGQEILGGNIGIEPMKQGSRTGCDYCPYHAVCGFDRKTAGYGYRKLRKLKPEEIWKEILSEEGSEEELSEEEGLEQISEAFQEEKGGNGNGYDMDP